MLKALRFKILIGTVAALAAVGGVIVHHKQQVDEQIRKEKIAAQLQHEREQLLRDDAENRQHQEDEKLMREVEALKKKSHAYPGGQSKTWTTKY